MAYKKTTSEFKEEIAIKYPELIVLGEYTGAAKKILVGCINGHSWEVYPTNLLTHGTGSRCRVCEKRVNTRIIWTKTNVDKLKELVSSGVPTEEIVQYFNSTKTAIDSACASFGIVRDRFLSHTIHKVHKLIKELNYTLVSIGKTSYENITYICNNGHTHTQNISNFLRGHYCPKCDNSTSNSEKEIVEFIKNNYDGWIIENDRSILGGRELDIVLPDLGLAFEYNGIYWHSEKHVDKQYHADKSNQVNDFEYQLIHIYEDDWLNKKELIQSKILSLLGKSYKIPARKCLIKEISYPKEFLNDNHLQGTGSPTKYNYGLYYNEELVAVMTFGKPRFNTQYDFELIRYCSLSGITVVGGASKLLKYFRTNNSGSIISYSNRSWSNGKLYKILGFKYSHTSEPNYKYYKKLNSLTRYECQKHKLKTLFPNTYKDELTEREIMNLEGYYAVYDSGNDVWVLDNK